MAPRKSTNATPARKSTRAAASTKKPNVTDPDSSSEDLTRVKAGKVTKGTPAPTRKKSIATKPAAAKSRSMSTSGSTKRRATSVVNPKKESKMAKNENKKYGAGKFKPVKTWLEVVERADNVPYFDPKNPRAYTEYFEKLWLFCVYDTDHAVGYMTDYIVKRMPWDVADRDFIIDKATRTVTIDPQGSGPPSKPLKHRPDPSLAVHSLLEMAIQKGASPKFKKFHSKGEAYPVIGSPTAFGIDRMGSELFGIVTAGAHCCAYTWVKSGKGKDQQKEMKLWIPRRAWDKPVDPGMLDNSVAGGIPIGNLPLDVMIEECNEEAGLDRQWVRDNIVSCGAVSYMRRQPHTDQTDLAPRIRFIYDLEIPEDMDVRPEDGEVAEFKLWSIEETMAALKEGEFKADPGLIWVDFFIRHGIITTETEPDLPEIVQRCHRKLPFRTPYTSGWNGAIEEFMQED